MQFGSVLSACTLAAIALATSETAFYALNDKNRAKTLVADTHNAELALADNLEVSALYQMDDDDETLQFLNNAHRSPYTGSYENHDWWQVEPDGPDHSELLYTDQNKLVVVVKGVVKPSEFFNFAPLFKVKNPSNLSNKKDLAQVVFNEFPQKYVVTHKNKSCQDLTPELKLVHSKGEHEYFNEVASYDFSEFDNDLANIWEGVRGKLSNLKLKQMSNVEKDNSETEDINDKLYINELCQLEKLEAIPFKQSVLYFKSNSLQSIAKKTGSNSPTYEVASKSLSDFLIKLSEKFDISVLVTSIDESEEISPEFIKRYNEIEEIFARGNETQHNSKKNTCFTSEEFCQAGTNNCNGRGVCTKSKSKCWTCLCSPTFDKKKKKTTRWTGYDCGKKEISFEANLLLWSSLAIIMAIVAGVSMLYNIGNEPLPGVLDAATSKKSN